MFSITETIVATMLNIIMFSTHLLFSSLDWVMGGNLMRWTEWDFWLSQIDERREIYETWKNAV